MTHFSADLIATEQLNPRTVDIDQLETAALLYRLNNEDALVAGAVREAIPQITPVIDRIVAAFEAQGRLIYVGAGTSGRLGVLDAAECPPTFSTPPEQVQALIAGGQTAMLQAVEGAEDSAELGQHDAEQLALSQNDVVIGLSASGGAAYVLAAMQVAQSAGAFTAAITCVAGSTLACAVEQPIVLAVGPEALAGSTRLKAGTAQKLVLNMLSTGAMIQAGKTYGNWMVDVRPTNTKLRKRACRIVATLAQTDLVTAETLLQQSHWQVKPAVLMHRLQLDLPQAQALLKQHQGKLRLALKLHATL